MKYFSMFSGIGGFELGIQRGLDNWLRGQIKGEDTEQRLDDNTQNGKWREQQSICVGYSEIDKYAIKVYERNFNESCDEHAHISQESKQEERTQGRKRSTDKQGLQLHDRNRSATLCNKCKGHTNYGNATTINAAELPDFDLLVGGFPCQAFSIAGKRAGFDDTRGTLFFDIARILKEKQPRHLVLENVKGLLSHDSGRTFTTIIGVLTDLGYSVEWQVLNSKDFGVPQNRERVIIVGHLGNECRRKVFPITPANSQTLREADFLRINRVDRSTKTYDMSRSKISSTLTSTMWKGIDASGRTGVIEQINQPTHSNDRVYADTGISPTLNTMQGGNRQPFIQDEPRIRRLTPIECERLQGFPDDWTKYGKDEYGMRVDISDTQRYKMCGNAVTTNVIQAVMEQLCV